MNLLLLQPEEIAADGLVHLTGRRHVHAREVLRVQRGQLLRVGVRGGLCGSGEVLHHDAERLELRVTLTEPPLERPGIDAVVAIPRPKALKRVLSALASLGVDRVALVNAAKVEKSYFDSKVLDPAFIAGLLDLGLEQARDTVPPVVTVHQRFKPFVEDELPSWPASRRLVPHPGAPIARAPVPSRERVTVAIGPDGGWVPFELECFVQQGFTPVSLGARVLRVEVAIPAVIGRVRG
ncbi:MAG: 16S rRNA (uracil(1498)-N(3))-methyltransferase [Archangium sp.]|nr:16S rRNA (uracil(1498)-N(3))-methyltransferase [Archangium sp.]